MTRHRRKLRHSVDSTTLSATLVLTLGLVSRVYGNENLERFDVRRWICMATSPRSALSKLVIAPYHDLAIWVLFSVIKSWGVKGLRSITLRSNFEDVVA